MSVPEQLLFGAIALALCIPAARTEPAAHGIASTARGVLTVCADPNNLPFSNEARQGFENRIIERVARDLGMQVRYTWWAQRRGFARHTLGEARCDVWPGVARGVEALLTTSPYYRSTYVFLTRKDRHLDNLSFDDSRLKRLSIGVQLIGDDAANTPPAHVLAERGLVGNVRGYPVYGDYGTPNPTATVVKAVARGDVDVALVWGPLAGYFAGRSDVPLQLQPASDVDGRWPMSFDICMGVRLGNQPLLEQIVAVLEKEAPVIDRILADYGVPADSARLR